MAKIAVFAKLTAAQGKADELQETLTSMVEAVADEQGTVFYALHRATDNPDVFWFYELYSDKEALGVHSTSDAMKDTLGKLPGLLATKAEITVSDPVAAKGVDL